MYLMMICMVSHRSQHSYNGLSNFGYGHLNEIPMIFILKYITANNIQANVLGMTYFPFHLIFERFMDSLNDVHLDTRVSKLDQSEDGVWNLHATNLLNGQEAVSSHECDKVILAYPPTEDALNLVHSLAQETKQLFSDNINVVDYWELAVTGLPSCDDSDYLSCLARDNAYLKNPQASNRLVPSMKIPNVMWQSKESDYVLVLYNAGSSMGFTQEDIFDNLR